jgi:hypothetical protein
MAAQSSAAKQVIEAHLLGAALEAVCEERVADGHDS